MLEELEALKVERQEFDQALLEDLASGSRVVDYYGLVEQVGIIYPLCESQASAMCPAGQKSSPGIPGPCNRLRMKTVSCNS